MNKQFANDVKEGLSKTPKSLSSKYFYDEKGSALFSKIMKLPEYYLTDAEFEIFQKKAPEIIKLLGITSQKSFDLIELGAGDGYKTIELLKALDTLNFQYKYCPIDISAKALHQIEENIHQQIPNKKIDPKLGDYFHILHELKSSPLPKIVLFLGSNIGNMENVEANAFLSHLSENLSKDDKIILGADLKKSKDIVLPAYNDSQGLTSAFNLNLLSRINTELDADFNTELFVHTPMYDEQEGVAKSAIKSTVNQEVEIKVLDMKVAFKKEEQIHTEISRKYDDISIQNICLDTGLKIVGKITDSKNYFADYIIEKQ
ncbi:L-histidine N(alpha)-methyltransferase [Arenibacter sp. ARW7G5Y1]|uniref:L-histidine N(alpha)-methyltransferase n=1 Tax=Arenibacter sp. ARW7G5Y1 TaxID=2135619 RepID=UPI000D761431|nr:L-histidine N(alpha)-methyltransferase [Arenibacter sp. ARW7G5Y1]PXX25751.1 dimethylhistidine N-methyltransferase [Arenibacter sp. ARW7G5Y1]